VPVRKHHRLLGASLFDIADGVPLLSLASNANQSRLRTLTESALS
jgi:hypothetical protein